MSWRSVGSSWRWRLTRATIASRRSKRLLLPRHNDQIKSIQEEIEAVDAELLAHINAHRSEFIAAERKSFATMIATFQFRKVTSKLKVVDADGLMTTARRLGIVRKIARLSVLWKLDREKFTAWLNAHGEHLEDFADFIDGSEDSESLTIKPNSTHTVFHDKKRISPPSITIKG